MISKMLDDQPLTLLYVRELRPLMVKLRGRLPSWSGKKCPNCKGTMQKWTANVTLPTNWYDDDRRLGLYVGGLPVVHCACGPGKVHLFQGPKTGELDAVLDAFERENDARPEVGEPQFTNIAER